MIFDTDVLIYYLRGNERARKRLAAASHAERQMSVVTHMELLAGSRGPLESRVIDKLAEAQFSRVHPLDESLSALSLRLIRRFAASHGLRLADALVAATALSRGHRLVTGNPRHFRFIPQLVVEPFKP